MADEKPRPTAEWLGAFKRDMEAEGLAVETITYLLQMAGRELIEGNGICVREVGRDG